MEVLVDIFNQENATVVWGLLRDCKTLHNLREGLFEALEQVEDGIIQ